MNETQELILLYWSPIVNYFVIIIQKKSYAINSAKIEYAASISTYHSFLEKTEPAGWSFFYIPNIGD